MPETEKPGQLFPLPYYTTDLNYVHQAETMTLKTDSQRKEYRSRLAECSDVFDATAEQRCAALLETLNLLTP